MMAGRHEEAILQNKRAIDLNPNSATAVGQMAFALTWSGDAEGAIPYFETAMRLSPRDPIIGRWTSFMAQTHMQIGKYAEALEWIKKAHSTPGMNFWAHAMKVCILGHLDRTSEAQDAFAEVLRLKPEFSCAFVEKYYPISDAGYLDHYLDGLRKARVPQG